MKSQRRKRAIPIYSWPNILRSTGNQTMTFDKLIKCNMKNFFLEKSDKKCGLETSPIPFSKKSK